MVDESINVLSAGEAYASLDFYAKSVNIHKFGGYEDTAAHLKKAMEEYSDVNLFHMPNHDISSEFPSTQEEIEKFDVVIVSDIGKYTLLLYPWERWFEVPEGPDRLKLIELIRKFVERSGGFAMCGGWKFFLGISETARYSDAPTEAIEEILPVHMISDRDDRVERPEGVAPKITEKNHPIVRGIPPDDFPPFSGYNELEMKEGATLIGKLEDNPFAAVRSYGDGRVMAFASDIAPHWGAEFVKWKYFPKFWHQSIKWLAGRA